MPDIKCYPQSNPDVVWNYCPSYAAAIVFVVMFGISTACQAVQAFVYRKSFTWVLIMGGFWECGGYIARTFSVEQQLNSGIFIGQFLLILLAPLWINAFAYMVLGRMIHFFLDNDKIYGIRARRITLIFVLFDITAFIVQCAGGTTMSGDRSQKVLNIGMGIYCGGIGLQMFAIFVFIAISVRFYQQVKKETQNTAHSMENLSDNCVPQVSNSAVRWNKPGARLLYALWATLGFIILRNIYRLIEYSQGFKHSVILSHEWFPYLFDAVPMLTAMALLNVFHPGKVLQGPRSGFSEENKALKLAKRERRMKRKEAKRSQKGRHSSGVVEIESPPHHERI